MPASAWVERIAPADEPTGAEHIQGRAYREPAGGRHRGHAAHPASVTTQCPRTVNPQALAAEFSESRRFIAWSDAGLADHDRDGHPVVILIEAGTGDDAGEVVDGVDVLHPRMVPRSAKWRYRLPS